MKDQSKDESKDKSKDNLINRQKKEISTLKRKISELEEEVFSNKRNRIDSEDITENENIKKLKIHINNIISEYIEILHTERYSIKKIKNLETLNKYINNKYPNGKLLMLACGARSNFEKYKGLDETI